MSSDGPGPRPHQVTIGGWVIAVASVMLVVSVFDTMANLHSVDTRDALTKALSRGSLRSLGLSVDDALSLMRAALFVAGAAAAVTGVLGIFVLQRHTAARIVLTVAAVPVVLTSPLSGLLLGALIGGSTILLWTPQSRDWFAGRPPVRTPARPLPEPASRREAGPPRSPWMPPPSPPATGSSPEPPTPPPTPGWGQAPRSGVPAYGPPPGPAPSGPTGWAPPYGSVPMRPPAGPGVPAPVRIACLLTWLFAGVTGGLYLVVGFAVALDRKGTIDLLDKNSSIRDTALTDDQLVALVLAVSALILVWCICAAGLALLAWRRHRWGWVLLLISIGVAGLVELPGLPYSFVNLAACVAAFVLLLRPQSRAWYRDAGGPGATPPTDGGSRPAEGWRPPPDWQPPTPGPPVEAPQGKPPVW